MNVTYAPGGGAALVGAHAVALLQAPAESPLVAGLWPAVEHGSDLLDLVEALVLDGVPQLPALALVTHTPGRLQVLVRGEAEAEIHLDGDTRVVSGRALATWHEEVFATTVRRVVLTLGGATSQVQLPTDGGVLLADRLEIALSTPAVDTGRHLLVLAQDPDEQLLAVHESSIESPLPDVPPTDLPLADDPLADAPSYDHMFEDTRRPPAPVPDLPVPAPEPLRSPDAEHPLSEPTLGALLDVPVQAPAAPAAPTAPVASSAGSPGGLIDAVPWASVNAPAAPLALAPSLPDETTDADTDHTVKRSDQDRLLQELLAGGDRVGPLVHAVLCSSGHLTDPQRDRCLQCGTAVPDATPITVPRPVLGQLRLSTGDVVVLDRGVLLGRNPKAEVDGERPHLVKVDNPAGDVSRNHVSVVLDGWHVLIKDLRSTNGTLVRLPGEQPQRLRADETMPIEPGTEVVIADGVSFRYELAS